MPVPKVLHQTWVESRLTEPCLSYRESWMRFNPEYIHLLHTDEDNDRLVNECYPEFKSIYYGSLYKIQRVDLVRLLYLHKFGGIYADIDVECLKPLHNLFDKDTIVLEPKSNKLGTPFLISNYVMAFEKDSAFVNAVLNEMIEKYRYTGNHRLDVCASTGCLLLSKVYNKLLTGGVEVPAVLDESYFTPYSHELLLSSRASKLALPEPPETAVGIHHYLGSWWQT